VFRCRPQRQEPGLRAGLRQGDRPPPDRDVFAADPHGRPYRGHPARRSGRARRLPLPHLGGDGHRRAETLGDAVHRTQREKPARLVWRRHRRRAFQWRHEHRPDASHRSHQGRHSPRSGPARRCSTTASRGRGSRDRTEGGSDARGRARSRSWADRHCGWRRGKKPGKGSKSCWSTTRTVSCTRWPTISARPARRLSPIGHRWPTACSTM
jgi:hypothetical protein